MTTQPIELPIKDTLGFLLKNSDLLDVSEYSRILSTVSDADLPFELVMKHILPFGSDGDPEKLAATLKRVPVIKDGKVRHVMHTGILDSTHSQGIALVLVQNVLDMNDADFKVIATSIEGSVSRIAVFNQLQSSNPDLLAKFFIRAQRCSVGITNFSVLMDCAAAGIFQPATEQVVRAILAERDTHKKEAADLQTRITSLNQSVHTLRGTLARLSGDSAQKDSRDSISIYRNYKVLFNNYNQI